MAKGGNKRRLTARRCSRKRLSSSTFRGNQYTNKKVKETVGNVTDVDSSNENFSEHIAVPEIVINTHAVTAEISGDKNTLSASARKLHLCQGNASHIETPVVEEEATVNGGYYILLDTDILSEIVTSIGTCPKNCGGKVLQLI